MSALTFLGLAAACCTTLAFVPQVVKAWKTRSTTDISLGMFLDHVYWDRIVAAVRRLPRRYSSNRGKSHYACIGWIDLLLKIRHG